MRNTYLRRALVATAAGAATLALAAGCGGAADKSGTGHAGHGQASSSTDTGGGHNSADVMFAQMMIPHHKQAVAMAELAPRRVADPKLAKLAEQIRGAQDPEITTMTGWLKAWGEPTSSGDMSGTHGDGMMTDADMAKLRAAKGAEFDAMFARMMVAHHKGAITMARTERSAGRNTAAKRLAGQIVTSQSAEVSTLRTYAGS